MLRCLDESFWLWPWLTFFLFWASHHITSHITLIFINKSSKLNGQIIVCQCPFKQQIERWHFSLPLKLAKKKSLLKNKPAWWWNKAMVEVWLGVGTKTTSFGLGKEQGWLWTLRLYGFGGNDHSINFRKDLRDQGNDENHLIKESDDVQQSSATLYLVLLSHPSTQTPSLCGLKSTHFLSMDESHDSWHGWRLCNVGPWKCLYISCEILWFHTFS